MKEVYYKLTAPEFESIIAKGEGWLFRELAEKRGITKNEPYWLKNLRIADLNSDSIAFAKKRLKEIGKL